MRFPNHVLILFINLILIPLILGNELPSSLVITQIITDPLITGDNDAPLQLVAAPQNNPIQNALITSDNDAPQNNPIQSALITSDNDAQIITNPLITSDNDAPQNNPIQSVLITSDNDAQIITTPLITGDNDTPSLLVSAPQNNPLQSALITGDNDVQIIRNPLITGQNAAPQNNLIQYPLITSDNDAQITTNPLITGDNNAQSSLVIAPHCSTKCGDIAIPYPFGIEEGCYYINENNNTTKPTMKITCDNTTNPPIPTLGSNIQLINISLKSSEIRINNHISFDCYTHGEQSISHTQRLNLIGFTISSTKNKLVVIGCDTYAWFTGSRHGESYYTGCMTKCDQLNDAVDGQCNGVGCCESSLPDGVTNMTSQVYSFSNHRFVPFNPCSMAFPVADDSYTFNTGNLTQDTGFYSGYPMLPVVFNWGIGSQNCKIAEKEGVCLCKNNTVCSDLAPDQDGYRCDCKDGYTGNAYLPQGCQDIDECKEGNECEKAEYCTNTDGGYFCKCPKGYSGDGTLTQGCVSQIWFTPVIVTAGIGVSIITLLVAGFLLHRRKGKRVLKELRESFFRQNGGLILHEKISGMDVLKIFTAQDLEYATDKYNENNIIGRGGFGVVYKGIIQNNQQVAIKRSLEVDPDQVEQFINEILVLSQINNRNVVKLLGCCLETEVPLLVYEFINNGTLYDHLHNEELASYFTWDLRLQIASEVAEVLAYLHTTISTPIIHRDMKTMNILLDEHYTAKVADFGASRLVPVDHAQLSTMVMGTLGYLDPEYMQTSELTEKSDVYSFGVVLVELVTRKKAMSFQRVEVERPLAMHFLVMMKRDRLFEIVDKNIGISEGEREQIKEVANLAKWCLRLNGDDRPTMKEVAMELEGIKRKTTRHPWHNVESSVDEQEDREHLLARNSD